MALQSALRPHDHDTGSVLVGHESHFKERAQMPKVLPLAYGAGKTHTEALEGR